MFNGKVIVDVMYITGKPVLHEVDRATNFQAARFVSDESTEHIPKTFMQIRSLNYLGIPENLVHDQGTQLVSFQLQVMAGEDGITCRPVGIAGSIERYGRRKTLSRAASKNDSEWYRTINQEVEPVREPGRLPKNLKKTLQSVNSDNEYLMAI